MPREFRSVPYVASCSAPRTEKITFSRAFDDLGHGSNIPRHQLIKFLSHALYWAQTWRSVETGSDHRQSVMPPSRVQSRRRVAQMHRARSKERSWAYLRHEFHGGALPGCGGGPPGLTENRQKGVCDTWSSVKKIKTKPVPPLSFSTESKKQKMGPKLAPKRDAKLDAARRNRCNRFCL